MKEILDQIKQYIEQKQANKTWTAGKDFVNYAGPHFTADEYVAAAETLLGGWLVMGDKSVKFEREFPKQFNKLNGILTNSGSSSNLLMMSALTSKRGHNLPKGTKVLMPIAGFPTTLNPTLQVGFEPVFVDIELGTLNLDLDHVERVLAADPDIRVITFAHVLGNPPNMDRLMELIKKHNLTMNFPLLGGFEHFLLCHFSRVETLTCCLRKWRKGR
jgi:CDP-6-deoxy-D-xylo-4-hexulose-3-dehydrase